MRKNSPCGVLSIAPHKGVIKAQLCFCVPIYGDDAYDSEMSARFRHSFEWNCIDWMVIRQTRRVLTWDDIEVGRASPRCGSLMSLISLQRLFKSSLRVSQSKFPFALIFFRMLEFPVGLAIDSYMLTSSDPPSQHLNYTAREQTCGGLDVEEALGAPC